MPRADDTPKNPKITQIPFGFAQTTRNRNPKRRDGRFSDSAFFVVALTLFAVMKRFRCRTGGGYMAYGFEKPNLDEFVSNCVRRLCPMCGLPVTPNPNGRPRKFCSDACRRAFWKHHPDAEKWRSFTEFVCPVCGRTFFAQKENNRTRKYCSHACANRGRVMKGASDEDR